MIKNRNLNKLKILLIYLISIFIVSALSFSTIAYFNFKKIYEGEGELPKLNIYSTVSTGDVSSLRNIAYTGQSSENIAVKLNTEGNNISGYVRVKVSVVWVNFLNNTPYNDKNELVTACSVSNSKAENAALWEERNGYFYLKAPMEKNTEVTLFDKINFANDLPIAYRGERVSIYVIAEIYQTSW